MKKILSVIMCLTLIFAITVPSAFALSGNVDAEIAERSKQIAIDAESEGIVLLKNIDNCLPLEGKKINVFGAGSVCPLLGGAGSGAITTADPVTFYEALDEEGIEYNAELKSFYEKNCGTNEIPKTENTVMNNLLQLMLTKSSLKEPSMKKLEKVLSSTVEFSDTAVIVISRTSAEASDIDRETLCLSDTEKQLVEKVTSSFENVIVLFNTANIMEMGWLDEYESIKAAAMIWIPGEYGLTAVARMLNGTVNPSGRLADTVAYHVDDHPSSESFGTYKYAGTTGKYYVQYLEGIYVGYRYFETFAKDKVQYPFGYGLSYTAFKKEATGCSISEDGITVTFKVTNTGSRNGKDTVQVYYSAPYKKGGIEKSSIVLAGFAKTKQLKPNESQTLKVKFKINDMASYDYKNKQAWVLEKGDYKIIASDNVRQHIKSFTYTNKSDVVIKKDSVTGTEIRNLFGDVYNEFTVLSRSDFSGTYPKANKLSVTDDVKNADVFPAKTVTGEAPKMGVKYDKTITLRDVYEDESLWDKFLDQLTLDEMTMLVIDGGYETYGIDRLGIPSTMDNDGPSSVKGRNGILYTDSGTAFPCETTIACTWNTELAERIGEIVGEEAADIGTNVWYAPAVNIHRSPMGGRNFEYFSEDPLISGKMAVAIINGCSSQDLVTTIKHFALNDQESHRNGIFTWADEQTMREIYLKAFEIAIKESDCAGVMSGYDRIGTKWCGASSALLNDLLRKEWGFDGYVISDYDSNFFGDGYMNPAIAVYNGNDLMLAGIWFLNVTSHKLAIKQAYKNDPIGFGKALREACKNILQMKMKTKAFLEPERVFDDSLCGALVGVEQWNFKFPYIFSTLRYFMNNILNIILFGARYIL